MAQLPKLPHLSDVLIQGPFTRRGLENLGQLPRLSSAQISSPQITDDDLVELAELRRLRGLWLTCPKVTDAGLVHLKGLDQLENLTLHCSMTDSGLVHLREMDRLENLTLAGSISDSGLRHLHALKRLQSLDCQTRPAIWSELHSATTLEYVEVPLTDCMQDLEVKHGVAIRIDRPSLDRVGIRPDAAITIYRPGVPLGDALDAILRPLKLGWTSDAQGIVIITAEKADEGRRGVRDLQKTLPNLKTIDVDW